MKNSLRRCGVARKKLGLTQRRCGATMKKYDE